MIALYFYIYAHGATDTWNATDPNYIVALHAQVCATNAWIQLGCAMYRLQMFSSLQDAAGYPLIDTVRVHETSNYKRRL